MTVKNKNSAYWSQTAEDVLKELQSRENGLNDNEVKKRRSLLPEKKIQSPLLRDVILFLSQFKSPLTLLLVFALALSAFLAEFTNALIIFFILFVSGFLGFIQERNAGRAAEKLRKLVQSKARVKRNGKEKDIPIHDVVQGDIILLEAGDIIPADGIILASKDLYVNESSLTGESFPSEKKTGTSAADAPVSERTNAVYKGTSVISGEASVVAVHTGPETELGKIQEEMNVVAETAFEKGIKQFGYFLMKVALVMAGIILIVNISMGRPPFDSILFALAISVGLAPELLPAIVTITLSAGARRLSKKKVIVKKLSSIQNLGSINLLCADKTGTLTEGTVKIHSFLGADGKPNDLIKKYAYLNAKFESGYPNPIDETIRKDAKTNIAGYKKFDEVPYDFIRKRISIVVENNGRHIMITKGALHNILEVCTETELSSGKREDLKKYTKKLKEEYTSYSSQGLRTIGICYKDVTHDPVINKDDENKMIFLGFILLEDPLKKDIQKIIEELKEKKVKLKIITGDNELVASHIAGQLGLSSKIITGSELHKMSDVSLRNHVNSVDIFAEAEPSQKERIVRALQHKGNVVGYLGDGINDASALKASDVGISVNNAVDVAKESADIILLKKDLRVLSDGITEGRKTYRNTMKYIFITVSANFGNMFSMAGASILLPFLPLLPAQILLVNFLTDLPALSIASDKVDEELLKEPRKLDVKVIRKFMIVFGIESSLFDFITFGILLLLFHTAAEQFRGAWFIESVITEILTLFIIRTRRTFFKSLPGKYLVITGLAVIILSLGIPFIPISRYLGFTPLPLIIVTAILSITICFGLVLEISKKMFFKRIPA